MPATLTDIKANSAFVAFTPRQVLLGMKPRNDDNASSNGTVQMKREEKVLLHNSIADYLGRCGFSKTLKKFRSEAQLEKGNVEGSSVDLEEMCLKYLELCSRDAKTNINHQQEPVAGEHSKKDGEGNLIADMDNVIKKKKKKKKDKNDSTLENFKGSMDSREKTNDSDPGSKVKSKEKGTDKKCKEKRKKSKLASESLANSVEDNQVESQPMHAGVNGDEAEKKSKSKKMTKKDKPCCDGDAKELQIGDPNKIVSKKDNFETSDNDVMDKSKDSKKRKRLTSEENVKIADRKADVESKRRKIDNFKQSKEGEQSAKMNANQGSDSNSKNENIGGIGQVGDDQSPTTYDEEHDRKTNGTNEKFSVKRSQKKQGSVEPKNGFQRVKIDEVKYVDERLQNNSYWAKDGADSGYGAKAEEILGQVRGRDFRHEKTKKKRGTYRGGQIDLESHSVKFNYSDDD